MPVVEMRYYDMAGISGVTAQDELHALYLKAQQQKMQNPEWRNDPNVWPWVTALWPTQPTYDNLWVPGMQLGYVLADPPAGKTMLGGKTSRGERSASRALDSMSGSGRKAITDG